MQRFFSLMYQMFTLGMYFHIVHLSQLDSTVSLYGVDNQFQYIKYTIIQLLFFFGCLEYIMLACE